MSSSLSRASLLLLAWILESVLSAQTPVRQEPSEPRAADPLVHLLELRRYKTQAGERDRLIDMFEGGFLDAYEAGGTRIVATFRDLDDPDLWVWIRAFPDAERRGPALRRFYTSESWKSGSDAANATILGVEDALLLRLPGGAGLAPARSVSRAAGATPSESTFVVTIYPLVEHGEDAFREFFEHDAVPLLSELGARPTLVLATDRSPNTYPGQPVRDETTFVTLTRFENDRTHAAFVKARGESKRWREHVQPELERIAGAPEVLRLRPTLRSGLR